MKGLVQTSFADAGDEHEQVLELRLVCPKHPDRALIVIQCPAWKRPIDPAEHLYLKYLTPHLTETRQGYMGTREERERGQQSGLPLVFADLPELAGDEQHTMYTAPCPVGDLNFEIRDTTLTALATAVFSAYARALGPSPGRRGVLTVADPDRLVRFLKSLDGIAADTQG